MIKNIYMALCAISLAGVISPAATEISPSGYRVFNYFSHVEKSVKPFPRSFVDAVELSYGQSDPALRNAKRASELFKQAGRVLDDSFRLKVKLYQAGLKFLGAGHFAQNLSAVAQAAATLVYAERALPIDRMRAFVLLDEITHMQGGLVESDKIALKELAATVGQLTCEFGLLFQEFHYRLARIFFYVGDVDKAAGYITLASKFPLKSATLSADVLKLQLEIVKVRVLQDASKRPVVSPSMLDFSAKKPVTKGLRRVGRTLLNDDRCALSEQVSCEGALSAEGSVAASSRPIGPFGGFARAAKPLSPDERRDLQAQMRTQEIAGGENGSVAASSVPVETKIASPDAVAKCSLALSQSNPLAKARGKVSKRIKAKIKKGKARK